MIKFLLGISLTLNIIATIAFFILYKYGFKKIRNKIENYSLELLDIDKSKLDKDFFDDLKVEDIYDNK